MNRLPGGPNGCLLPSSAPSAFPAVQYLSQPQPQPYAVHSHFQPTQTGDGRQTPRRGPVPAVLLPSSSPPFSTHLTHPSSPPRLPPARWRPVLTKADGTR